MQQRRNLSRYALLSGIGVFFILILLATGICAALQRRLVGYPIASRL
ncbi:hypothetical protein [Acidicapsa acidisoli]|nr:hypothetical protein [Acidicapsa acidisoli]